MRWSLALCGWLLVQAFAVAQDSTQRDMHEMHRLHQDPTAYIAMLDDPARDAYQKPHEVITALKFKPGEVIADIGAGSGYFTFRLAHHVGDTGRVYAVDVSPNMIVHLNRRIRDLQVKNVVTILAAPDDPLLAAAAVDRFLICDTWHHIGVVVNVLLLLVSAPLGLGDAPKMRIRAANETAPGRRLGAVPTPLAQRGCIQPLPEAWSRTERRSP
jgi:SAM-dependent methyltransferase